MTSPTSLPPYISFLKQNRTREQAEEIFQQRIDDAREVFERFGDRFEERPCPFCGSQDQQAAEKFDERYGVSRCATCASHYVNPAPTIEALTFYYNECECNAQLGALLRARVGQGNVILSERGEHVIELMQGLLAEKQTIRVLEIGCNSGAFLFELNEQLKALGLADRVELEGIDIDEHAVARSVTDEIKLRAGSAEDIADRRAGSYDLVLHFELIEHLFDPHGFLQAVAALLVPGGICHFHTPNGSGFDNTALGYNDFRPLAHGIFPPMHLQAFTPQNALLFSVRSGLQMVSCETPGNFDVDIVREFVSTTEPSEFHHIDRFSTEQLAILQRWLRLLKASSHMSVTLRKPFEASQ